MSDLLEKVKPYLPVPKCDKTMEIICGIVNFIIPGLGLCIATLIQPGERNNHFLLLALLEFVCTIIVFGWIWSIVNGVYMIIEGVNGGAASSEPAKPAGKSADEEEAEEVVENDVHQQEEV